ncbi:hypothetical protein E4K67_27295 [Desulfosporosinus fructosivorans]|uniref:Uncharacterized protein n=1 Tax=Desulfosporosinus fructosivorans TaxID=2018669 RepID=A0A4Z0QX67_9FIRM|nr:hypothetical protein [Desulfosporosinus fructosivorans]TGE35020.1 hypothetical protein E4K67_27295 [Desulfosporosinus fructosivorans]
MSDISQTEYIETLEQKTKIIASYFRADVKRAEETNDYSNVKQRIPLILDMISVYDDLGTGDRYYSSTCSEFIEMLAQIQKGLGMNDEYRNTLTALNQYQKGVELQDTNYDLNRSIHPDTNVDQTLNPTMY